MATANGRKTIFLTGAASGIGRATAELFADRGWFCGLSDIDAAGLEETHRLIGADNGMTVALDVCDRDQWASAMAAFSEATDGRMHVLFNNAGIGRHGWFEDIPPEEADLIVDINVKGVVNGVYAALPLLKETKDARIVNVASAAGLYGSPQLAVYSATKFAVRGLTEALDLEFASLGVKVTSLMPFFVDTPILNMSTGDGSNHNMKDQIKEMGADVYPVSLAAEQAWKAAHDDALHTTVGKAANRLRFFSRFLPGTLRKQILGSLPERA